jgi:predicted Zn-dependent protease
MTQRRPIGRERRVEMQFLEAVRGRCPHNPLLLEALGELYTRAGRFQEGLQVDLELVGMRPDEPVAWYNLGCSYALTGQREQAFNALTKAVDLGYADTDWMLKDSDLQSLREDPRFPQLVKRVNT